MGLTIESDPGVQSEVEQFARKFADAFGRGPEPLSNAIGFSGRILRGKSPVDFETLTDNPNRKVVFLLDSSDLGALIGLKGRAILQAIGYPESTIDGYLQKGIKFKMVAFPETSAKLATWDNLITMAGTAYPEHRKDLFMSRDALKKLSYSEAISIGSAITRARIFLRDELNINELFRGDGLTSGGHKEYITLNKKLTDMGPHAIVEFPVEASA